MSGNNSYSDLLADKVIGYTYFVVCFIGTVANSLMLLVIIAKLIKKKFNPTALILLQLCCIDLIGCSVQAPVVSYALVRNRTIGIDENGALYGPFCDIVGFLSTLIPLLSVYLTTSLCFIRFVGVYYVFSSRRMMTIRRVVMLCVVSWVVSILCASTPFYTAHHYQYTKTVGAFYMTLDYANVHKVLLIFIKLAVNMAITVPFLITVICCIFVVIKLRSGNPEKRHGSSSSADSNSNILTRVFSRVSSRDTLSRDPKFLLTPVGMARHRIRHRTISHLKDTDSSSRASTTIMIITIAFIIAYGPYMIIWVYSLLAYELKLFQPVTSASSPYWHTYMYVYLLSTNFMSTVNSCIFPIIYFIRVKRGLGARIWDAFHVVCEKTLFSEKSEQSFKEYVRFELLNQAVSV